MRPSRLAFAATVLACAAVLGQPGSARAVVVGNGFQLNALVDNALAPNALSPNALTDNGVEINGVHINGIHLNGVGAADTAPKDRLAELDGVRVEAVVLPGAAP